MAPAVGIIVDAILIVPVESFSLLLSTDDSSAGFAIFT